MSLVVHTQLTLSVKELIALISFLDVVDNVKPKSLSLLSLQQ